MHSFPNFESLSFFLFVFNCCFLTCIQISQEAGKVVWYLHLLKNFSQFVEIHTIKGKGTGIASSAFIMATNKTNFVNFLM